MMPNFTFLLDMQGVQVVRKVSQPQFIIFLIVSEVREILCLVHVYTNTCIYQYTAFGSV